MRQISIVLIISIFLSGCSVSNKNVEFFLESEETTITSSEDMELISSEDEQEESLHPSPEEENTEESTEEESNLPISNNSNFLTLTEISTEVTTKETTQSDEVDEEIINREESIPLDWYSIEYIDGYTIFECQKERWSGTAYLYDDWFDFEGMSGLHGVIDGDTLTYEFYKHSPDINDFSTINIVRVSDNKTIVADKTIDKYVDNTIDLSKFSNGVYYIEELSTLKDTTNTNHYCSRLYFLVNGDDSYLCRATKYDYTKSYESKRAQWQEYTGHVDPETQLEIDSIVYPTCGKWGRCVQLEEWRAKAHEIIGDNDEVWSDEFKVYMFVTWINNNIAYDKYKVNTLHIQRATYISRQNGDGSGYKDDNNFAYYNGVGTCWDYVNILAIMCREYGIPCTSVENQSHTWNAVWLNGHWVAIDITGMYFYECNAWDTNDTYATNSNHRRYSQCYGEEYWCGEINKSTGQVWTRENADDPSNSR